MTPLPLQIGPLGTAHPRAEQQRPQSGIDAAATVDDKDLEVAAMSVGADLDQRMRRAMLGRVGDESIEDAFELDRPPHNEVGCFEAQDQPAQRDAIQAARGSDAGHQR